MYYGRSLTEMAPEYVSVTVKSIAARKKKISELENKVETLKAEYPVREGIIKILEEREEYTVIFRKKQ